MTDTSPLPPARPQWATPRLETVGSLRDVAQKNKTSGLSENKNFS